MRYTVDELLAYEHTPGQDEWFGTRTGDSLTVEARMWGTVITLDGLELYVMDPQHRDDVPGRIVVTDHECGTVRHYPLRHTHYQAE